MSEEGKKHHHHLHLHHHQQPEPTAPPPQYGTFQGEPGYPPPQPAIGFPQPVPPPGAVSASDTGPTYYTHGYQAVPVQGYAAVAEGRPVREPRRLCCGCGMGWCLLSLLQ
uniref:60S ribosomal protein L18a-1 n=1 Tax=Anthurium amnicola TaxID=1678845 RepID=A0A1D1XND4_9ARAE